MCHGCIAQPSVALVLAGLASIYPGPSWMLCDPLTAAALKWHFAIHSGSHMRVLEGRRRWFDLQTSLWHFLQLEQLKEQIDNPVP